MKFVIPIPPSKNEAYVEQAVAKKAALIPAVQALVAGRKGAWTKVKRAMNVIRRRSDAYEAYLERLQPILAGQHLTCVAEDVAVEVTVFFADRRRDMANVIDVLLDSLEGHAYTNDRYVVDLRIRRELDADDPRCVVTVRALNHDLFAQPEPEGELHLEVEF